MLAWARRARRWLGGIVAGGPLWWECGHRARLHFKALGNQLERLRSETRPALFAAQSSSRAEQDQAEVARQHLLQVWRLARTRKAVSPSAWPARACGLSRRLRRTPREDAPSLPLRLAVCGGASGGRSSTPSWACAACARVRPVRPWLRSTSSPTLARFCPVRTLQRAKTRQVQRCAGASSSNSKRSAVLRGRRLAAPQAGRLRRLCSGRACFCIAFLRRGSTCKAVAEVYNQPRARALLSCQDASACDNVPSFAFSTPLLPLPLAVCSALSGQSSSPSRGKRMAMSLSRLRTAVDKFCSEWLLSWPSACRACGQAAERLSGR